MWVDTKPANGVSKNVAVYFSFIISSSPKQP